VDGRSERGARNRQAIVDAALAFVAENDALPTTQQVAERAGVAPRSVFHHFSSLDALFVEAAQTQGERWWTLLCPPEPGLTVTERLTAALTQRTALFEQIGAVRRVAVRHESSSDVLAERLRESRDALRRHLRRALNPELADLDPPAVAGIEAAASWETWDLLRKDLSADAVTAAMKALIEPALTRAPALQTSKE
jgi:TetR/AcrR family transcriptional regulator, regulator of autoinduction and epiphytic fitness